MSWTKEQISKSVTKSVAICYLEASPITACLSPQRKASRGAIGQWSWSASGKSAVCNLNSCLINAPNTLWQEIAYMLIVEIQPGTSLCQYFARCAWEVGDKQATILLWTHLHHCSVANGRTCLAQISYSWWCLWGQRMSTAMLLSGISFKHLGADWNLFSILNPVSQTPPPPPPENC